MMRLRAVSAALLLMLGSANAFGVAKVGDKAPEFSLVDSHGKAHKLADYKGKFVVLEWFNKDCPFVKKHYDSANMQTIQKTYTGKNVAWLTVISSSKEKQGYQASAEINKYRAEKNVNSTATLIDEKGAVGKLYDAKTTPHMFVINDKGVLVYKGAIDDKPTAETDDVKSAKNYVTASLDQAMSGKPVTENETTPYGCSVKY